MRFCSKNTPSCYERHKWFAWCPVKLTGTDTIVWLEYVLRKNDIETPCAYYDDYLVERSEYKSL